MPIEVRELVIRVRVEDQPVTVSPAKGGSVRQVLNERELQYIVATCAEQVLKILQQQKEK